MRLLRGFYLYKACVLLMRTKGAFFNLAFNYCRLSRIVDEYRVQSDAHYLRIIYIWCRLLVNVYLLTMYHWCIKTNISETIRFQLYKDAVHFRWDMTGLPSGKSNTKFRQPLFYIAKSLKLIRYIDIYLINFFLQNNGNYLFINNRGTEWRKIDLYYLCERGYILKFGSYWVSQWSSCRLHCGSMSPRLF